MRLFLIGARGSGKTTVGRVLAERMGWEAIDLDEAIVASARKTIREIVESEGWDKFRDLESETLKLIGGGERRVVATGGGVILRKENRDFMRENGKVIWLKASPRVMFDRLAASPLADQRPALTKLGMEEEIRDILKEREPLYAECASHIANADRDAASVCDTIADLCSLPPNRG